MKRPRILQLNKRLLALFAADILLLIVLAVLLLVWHGQTHLLPHEQAAQRWRGESEMGFAQVSCYLSETEPLTVEGIYGLRSAWDQALLNASLEQPANGSLYTDAYSSMGELTLKNGQNSVTVQAIGVGGDFFFFHPLQLRSGSYLSPNDLMQDRIVLDEDTAWKLFGSCDIAGQEVTINSVPYLVAGVVRHMQDKPTMLAEQGKPFIFVDHSVIAEQSNITCYELAMADPIEDFVLTAVQAQFEGIPCHIVENSSRYGVENIAGLRLSYKDNIMVFYGIAFPSWENAARYTEATLSQLLPFMLLAALLPFATVCGIIIHYGRKLHRHVTQKIEARKIQA